MFAKFKQIIFTSHGLFSADIGEACTSDEYCLFKDSRCDNSICRCITGIYDETAKKCDISKLIFPHFNEHVSFKPKSIINLNIFP